MFDKPITFDTFIRGMLTVLIVIAVFLLINYLGGVLLPFFVAWLLAYLLHPVVCFVRDNMGVKNRALAIIVTFAFIVIVSGGILWFIIPPMIRQFEQLGSLIEDYIYVSSFTDNYPAAIGEWISENKDEIQDFFRKDEVSAALHDLMPQVFRVISRTAGIIISIVASFIMLIYLFFILLDYDRLSAGVFKLFPRKSRPFWRSLFDDVERELNSYIRGQSLVALCIGILFCIGFTIIDFPMAIGLGILIGIMSLVPYVHGLAFIPMILLSVLQAAKTGDSFWSIMLAATTVFVIIQLITDLILVPRIMGKAMRLSPAVILLSLSVWGTLLGFIGLIVALPLTTLLLAYYRRYITKDEETVGSPTGAEEK